MKKRGIFILIFFLASGVWLFPKEVLLQEASCQSGVIRVEGEAPTFPGAMAHYSFEGRNANDMAGDHDGTAYGGPTYVPGEDGLGLNLDGIDDYIQIPSNPDFVSNATGGMTFAVTIQSEDFLRKQAILAQRHPYNNDGHFRLFVMNGRLCFSFYSTDSAETIEHCSDTILMNGNRYKIVWVKRWGNSGFARLYVNGTEVPVTNPDSIRSGSNAQPQPIIIGAQLSSNDSPATGPQLYFAGVIDEVRVWNRPLLPEEIGDRCPERLQFCTTSAVMIVSPCFLGMVESLKVNGQEQLSSPGPLGWLMTRDQTKRFIHQIIPEGNDLYKVDFGSSDAQIMLSVTGRSDYFIFDMDQPVLTPPDITAVGFLNLKTTDNVQHPLLDTLSLNVDTVCGRHESVFDYYCRTSNLLDLANGKAALVVTPSESYWQTIRRVVEEQGLPNVVMEDGRWFRESDPSLRSYLFAAINTSNQRVLLELARRGRFGRFLAMDPVLHGRYDTPPTSSFPNRQQFLTALGRFARAGIHLGLHTHLNRIDPTDPLFTNPTQRLYSIPVALLREPISHDHTNLPVELTDQDLYNHYASWQSSHDSQGGSNTSYTFAIDGEVVICSGYLSSPIRLLTNCQRGRLGTTATSHSPGATIAIMPRYLNYFINPDDIEAKAASVASFNNFVERIGARFIYADASVFPTSFTTDQAADLNHKQKIGLLPYIEGLQNFPALQFGDDNGSSFARYYADRSASWDGPQFENKAFTRQFKVGLIQDTSPYASFRYEMGWWGVHGVPPLVEGSFDYRGTTADDVHYAMGKTLAFGTSIGVQLSFHYDKNKQLVQLFDLIGQYHRLIRRHAIAPLIPNEAVEYLKQPFAEAYLVVKNQPPSTTGILQQGISLVERARDLWYSVIGPMGRSQRREEGEVTFHLVRKEESRHQAAWNLSPYSFEFYNPFAGQKPRIEIRARPDYKGFSDGENVTLADFTNVEGVNLFPSAPAVTCLLERGGRLVIQNSGTTGFGGCRISLSGSYNLGQHRGIGIDITGQGGGEQVVVSLKSAGMNRRDFELLVDFSGNRQVILAEPTSRLRFEVNGNVTPWPLEEIGRFFYYNYNTVSGVELFISNIPPGATRSLTLHAVKALKEKGTSPIVNPTLNINGTDVVFPVTLNLAPQGATTLEYDGHTGSYRTYSDNHELRGEGSLTTSSLILRGGANELSLNSNISEGNSSRAEVRIIAFDDEDGDGIPTDGDYRPALTHCSGSLSFCDDNCPNVYNPEQLDDDHDGIGNACDQGPASNIVAAGCGDGVRETNEACDDGNTTNCDGCRADCSAVETGCGDGFICGAEQCDDGNINSGDGCSVSCGTEGDGGGRDIGSGGGTEVGGSGGESGGGDSGPPQPASIEPLPGTTGQPTRGGCTLVPLF